MVLDRWRGPTLRPWRSPRLFEDMERFFGENLANWPFQAMWRRMPSEEMSWAPAMEVYEKDDDFIIHAELPGMNKDDIDITMTGDTLTIRGERKASEDIREEQYHRCEVCYGSFSRSVVMPAAVDFDKVDATYENGILEIHVPKAKEAKPTKIQIKGK